MVAMVVMVAMVAMVAHSLLWLWSKALLVVSWAVVKNNNTKIHLPQKTYDFLTYDL